MQLPGRDKAVSAFRMVTNFSVVAYTRRIV